MDSIKSIHSVRFQPVSSTQQKPVDLRETDPEKTLISIHQEHCRKFLMHDGNNENIRQYGWGFEGIDSESAEYICKGIELAHSAFTEKSGFMPEALKDMLEEYRRDLEIAGISGCCLSQTLKVYKKLIETISSLESSIQKDVESPDSMKIRDLYQEENLVASRRAWNKPKDGVGLDSEILSDHSKNVSVKENDSILILNRNKSPG